MKKLDNKKIYKSIDSLEIDFQKKTGTIPKSIKFVSNDEIKSLDASKIFKVQSKDKIIKNVYINDTKSAVSNGSGFIGNNSLYDIISNSSSLSSALNDWGLDEIDIKKLAEPKYFDWISRFLTSQNILWNESDYLKVFNDLRESILKIDKEDVKCLDVFGIDISLGETLTPNLIATFETQIINNKNFSSFEKDKALSILKKISNILSKI